MKKNIVKFFFGNYKRAIVTVCLVSIIGNTIGILEFINTHQAKSLGSAMMDSLIMFVFFTALSLFAIMTGLRILKKIF